MSEKVMAAIRGISTRPIRYIINTDGAAACRRQRGAAVPPAARRRA
jgi:hypothetical protein